MKMVGRRAAVAVAGLAADTVVVVGIVEFEIAAAAKHLPCIPEGYSKQREQHIELAGQRTRSVEAEVESEVESEAGAHSRLSTVWTLAWIVVLVVGLQVNSKPAVVLHHQPEQILLRPSPRARPAVRWLVFQTSRSSVVPSVGEGYV